VKASEFLADIANRLSDGGEGWDRDALTYPWQMDIGAYSRAIVASEALMESFGIPVDPER